MILQKSNRFAQVSSKKIVKYFYQWYWGCNKFACVTLFQIKYQSCFVFNKMELRNLSPHRITSSLRSQILAF